MQLTDIPSKFAIPFANAAIAPYIRTIPQTPSGTPGQAALTTGFPPENFSPVAAGGVPPFGSDFNGVLNQSTAWNRWQAAGVAFPPYDPSFQSAVAGYPKYACVSSLVSPALVYISIVDNNVTNPDTGGAGWIVFWRQLTVNTDIYVNTSTGNDSNNGLSPATAKKTIQAAILTAWTFPPSSSFTITIRISDGTYAESVSTPSIPGPAITVVGNVGTPSNVLITGGSGSTFALNGPNIMTVQGVKASCAVTNAAAFAATGSGGQLTLTGTVLGSCVTYGNLATNGATINLGTQTISANCGNPFSAFVAGQISLVPSSVFTISAAITVSSFALANSGGVIVVPATGTPTFVNPGNVTSGARYLALLNGVINTQGQGANYFPGASAGSTNTGGQYA